MYDDEMERLDALGKMTAAIASGMFSHKATLLGIMKEVSLGNAEQTRKEIAKEVVAIARALVEEIKATTNNPGSQK